ncbi:MAG: hypothetical protein RBS99_12055 [Rhodospirillales bacterium]|jgi:hypothetical protein|nr:hypothetical protein [Rhodospirillales bacterium]
MGGILGGGSVPQSDTSYLDEQRRQADEDRAKAERENQARLRARRGRAGRSLLQYGDERGVTGEATLG